MVKALRLLAGAALFSATPAAAQKVQAVLPIVQVGETLLLVEASGSIEVAPEKISMSISVVSTGETAAAALDSNNVDMQRVINAFEQFALAEGELHTADFRVRPQFPNDRRSGDRTEILGYKAENTINVMTSDILRAGDMIAAAFEAGANEISGPYFNVEDATADAGIRTAERKALAQARAQADNTADALGLRVSRVLRISNREIDFDRRERGGYIVVTGSRIAQTPIVAGKMPLSVTVFVEYALLAAD